MSQESVIDVISKAVGDTEFRGLLFSDPVTALTDYDLTAEERESLSALEEEAFDAFASELEDRISKFAPPYTPIRPGDELVNVAQIFRAEVTPRDIGRLFGG
jgi:hypothetical protein